MKCQHIKKCGQKIVAGSLALCNGARKGYDFDKCYKWHSLDAQGKHREAELKVPQEWAGKHE